MTSAAPLAGIGKPLDAGPAEPTASDWHACRFTSWYDVHVPAEQCLAGRAVPLPPGFAAFLLADGVRVGVRSGAMPSYDDGRGRGTCDGDGAGGADSGAASSSSTSSSSGGGGSARGGLAPSPAAVAAAALFRGTWASGGGEGGGASSSSSVTAGEDEDDDNDDWFAPFPGFRAAVETAICDLGGRVAVKGPWSAPLDATWANPTGTTQCTNADEAALLLKASDRVATDLGLLPAALAHAAASTANSSPVSTMAVNPPGAPFPTGEMVLKRWYDLRPTAEFRLYVAGGRVVGAARRYADSGAGACCLAPADPAAAAKAARRTVAEADAVATTDGTGEARARLGAFYARWLRRLPLRRCACDVYLVGFGEGGRGARLVDVNPWGQDGRGWGLAGAATARPWVRPLLALLDRPARTTHLLSPLPLRSGTTSPLGFRPSELEALARTAEAAEAAEAAVAYKSVDAADNAADTNDDWELRGPIHVDDDDTSAEDRAGLPGAALPRIRPGAARAIYGMPYDFVSPDVCGHLATLNTALEGGLLGEMQRRGGGGGAKG